MTNNNKKSKKNQFQGGPKKPDHWGPHLWLPVLLILAWLTDYTRQTVVIPYSTF